MICVKSACSGLLLGSLLMVSQALLAKDIAFSQKFEWDFDVDAEATIVITNYDCDIIIEPSTSNRVRFEIHLDVESKEQEDIEILRNYLESLSFPARRDQVKLETTFWDSRSSNSNLGNKVIKMKLKNGKSIKLSEFNIKATLSIPASCALDFTTKYSTVEMTDVKELKLDSYDDKLYGKNVADEVNIVAKYSKMEFVNLGTTEMDIYDCHFTAEKTEGLTIVSKYSDININTAGNIDLEGYDDNMIFKTTGDIKLSTKYSDLNGNVSGNLTLNIYDSDLEIDEIGNLSISESKYSGYTFNKINNATISSSYDDEFSFESLGSLKVLSSKYSSYSIDQLVISFEIPDGYDDNIKIHGISSSFTHLDVNSKYSNIALYSSSGSPLKIDWKTKYGKIDFSESDFKTRIMIKDNSEYQYEGVRGTEAENMPYVKVRGYDVKMNLNN